VTVTWADDVAPFSQQPPSPPSPSSSSPFAAFPSAATLVLADRALFAPPARQRALAGYVSAALAACSSSCRRLRALQVRANCRLQRDALAALGAAAMGGGGGAQAAATGAPSPCRRRRRRQQQLCRDPLHLEQQHPSSLLTLDLGPAAAAVRSPSACGHALEALACGAAAAAAVAAAARRGEEQQDGSEDDDEENAKGQRRQRQRRRPSQASSRTSDTDSSEEEDDGKENASWREGQEQQQQQRPPRTSPAPPLLPPPAAVFAERASACDECLLRASRSAALSGARALALGDCSRVTAAGMRAALCPAAAAHPPPPPSSSSATTTILRSLLALPPTLPKPTTMPFGRLCYLRLGNLRADGAATLAPLARLPRLSTLALYLCDLSADDAFDGLAGLWPQQQVEATFSSSSPLPPPSLAALLVLSAPDAASRREALSHRHARAIAALPALKLLATDGGAERGALRELARCRALEHLELARVDEAELIEAATEAEEAEAAEAARGSRPSPPAGGGAFSRPSPPPLRLSTVRTLWLRHAGRLPAEGLAAAFPSLKRFGCRELSSRLRAPQAWRSGGAAAAATTTAEARVRGWLRGLEAAELPAEAWTALLCAAGAAAPSGAVALERVAGGNGGDSGCLQLPALRSLSLLAGGGDAPRFEAGAHASALRATFGRLVAANGGGSTPLEAGLCAALQALRAPPPLLLPADQEQQQLPPLMFWRRRSSSTTGGCPPSTSSSSLSADRDCANRDRSPSADGGCCSKDAAAAAEGDAAADDNATPPPTLPHPLAADHERAVAAVFEVVEAAAASGNSRRVETEQQQQQRPEQQGQQEEEEAARPHPLAWRCGCVGRGNSGLLEPHSPALVPPEAASGADALLLWAAAAAGHCPALRALKVRGGGGGGGTGAAADADEAPWARAVAAAPALAWLSLRPDFGVRAAVLPPPS
jgi:hypothetical protein